jgi:hypothetical protein
LVRVCIKGVRVRSVISAITWSGLLLAATVILYLVPASRHALNLDATDLLLLLVIVLGGSFFANLPLQARQENTVPRGRTLTPGERLAASVGPVLLGVSCFLLSGVPGAEGVAPLLKGLGMLMFGVAVWKILRTVRRMQ